MDLKKISISWRVKVKKGKERKERKERKMAIKKANFSATLPPQNINPRTNSNDSGYFREDKMSPRVQLRQRAIQSS